MRFLSKSLEVGHSWECHSTGTHSIDHIQYLGLTTDHWVVLELFPRPNNPLKILAGAIRSVCVNMLNPDEEGTLEPKRARFWEDTTDNSVMIELEDVGNFLNQLRACKCITKNDANVVLHMINTVLQRLNTRIDYVAQNNTLTIGL